MIKVPNEQALRDGIAHAELHLSQWHQGGWVQNGLDFEGEECGTTACLAGHILLARGHSWEDLMSGEGISIKAIRALGFDVRDMDHDSEAFRFYRKIFGFTWVDDVGAVGINPDRMKLFKERITAVTGIEL